MVIKNKKTLLATLAVSGVMYGSLAYADSHKGVHRNGRSRSGHQRYLCQSCRHSWQREFTYATCRPGTHKQIVDMAMNGMGCRATARVMGIGLNTVLRHLKSSDPNR